MLVTAEQVLAHARATGAFDAALSGLIEAFEASEQGAAFEAEAAAALQRAADDPEAQRAGDRAAYLERRLAEHFGRGSGLERLEADARNWLLGRGGALGGPVARVVGEMRGADGLQRHGGVQRALELDPPRLAARGHSFYRRGDAVAAFLSVADPLALERSCVCLSVEIAACDSARNMYTVRDPDAAPGGRAAWVVYWDQMLAIRRPHEQSLRPGDQVYALFRDDYSPDMAVTTEFFPGRVEASDHVTVAVRFDTGELAHVYYDEAFPAGRVGFLRRLSDDRRRARNAPGATVDIAGRPVPSFTGFWPATARPALHKHGRRVRHRQPPPILIDHRSRYQSPPGALSPGSSSDMDLGSSNASPSPAPAEISGPIETPGPAPVVSAPAVPTPAPPAPNVSAPAPPPPEPAPAPVRRRPTRFDQGPPLPSPGEEGEIDTGEEGEVRSPPAHWEDAHGCRRRASSRSSSRHRSREPYGRGRYRSREPYGDRYTSRDRDWGRDRSRDRMDRADRRGRSPSPDRGAWPRRSYDRRDRY
ncbi:hypothetical protein H4R18_004315 [Coemansia javaensis]|uniref:SGF29 C-terminal domain-containing protein n=1 Tax=Coemansia javaensis TaxID=2761396 RepID=A0A9W8H6H7_9FUNG|nr:hypothetical protein H4R18_004315 [Coemansia javaensis]